MVVQLTVVPMPLDSEGGGPADEADAVRTVYEVWDDCNITVATFDTRDEAESFVRQHTRERHR